MSEQPTVQPQDFDLQQVQALEVSQSPEMASVEQFSQSLNRLEQTVPEVTERRIELEAAGRELIEIFGVTPDFFDDHSRATIFTALAGNYATLQKLPVDEQTYRKQDYVASATFLLTEDYSDKHAELKAINDEEVKSDEVTDAHAEATYQRYTDGTATKRFVEKIKAEGYLEEVADKLGAEGEPTDEVKIRVLNIGSSSDYVNIDYKAAGLTIDDAMSWSLGLEKNRNQFAADMIDASATLAAEAGGFAIELDGKENFMVPRISAEVLLAEEDGIELSEHAKSWNLAQSVIGTLRHEYVHTQGGIRVAKYFGFALEERRAEHFSGNTGEYYDVKQMVNDLAILSGVHIQKLFNSVAERNKQGESANIYDELANTYGIDTLLPLATAMPSAYVPYIKSTVAKDMYRQGPKMNEVAEVYASSMSEEQMLAATQNLKKAILSAKSGGVADNDSIKMYFKDTSKLIGFTEQDIDELLAA